jgi:hypothetical protein
MAGCAANPPQPPPASPSPPARWLLAEREGLLVFEKERRARLEVEVRLLEESTADVGESRTIEVRVTSAGPAERHRFRVRAASVGVTFPDGELLETRGTEPARIRFTSDRPGRATVAVRRIGP